ncbi:hypothetical protein EV421DRAFT_1868478 [Armillaria borealis]|uniref:Uncharacterized protein n=1 Tax=Armillaria borealis TaxID=47425 RepID=A0AA39M500_9AGAR|nr:hypothetical protein EV421DRAFT_1868478 [Armillaria borealis]
MSLMNRSIPHYNFHCNRGVLRILFSLRYLACVLSLQEHRMPTWCLESNVDLWVQGKPCWLGGIVIVLRRLGFTDDKLSLESLLNPEDVDMLIKAIPQKCTEWAHGQIESSSRLELMQGSGVERLRGGRSSSDPLLLRSYLLVRIRDRRVGLTRILTASHALEVERGRWMTVRSSSVHVPRAFRLCRMCHNDVEDEMHILFTYPHSDLEDLRKASSRCLAGQSRGLPI